MRILRVLLLLSVVGCSANSPLIFRKYDEGTLAAKIAASPIVELSGRARPAHSAEVEIYYRNFNVLNYPGIAENWQHHYVIAPGTNPTWSYTEIGEIFAYQLRIDDISALATMKAKAASLGADAIVEVYREPIIDRNPTPQRPAKIYGYGYRGQLAIQAR